MSVVRYEEEIKRLRTMIDSRAAGMPGGGRLGSPPDGTHSFDRRAEVAQQQQQIDLLQAEMRLLYQQMKTLQPSQLAAEADEPPPPHY